ncbi:MAG: MFS transporter [Kofleriaceae bacterium]|nr:MFS transporter [Kofleriaceae bacterium]
MPRQIPFIIGNEGCERFSFYGMRNILYQFLPASMLLLHLPESARAGAAKDVFHMFVMGVYFFPLLGGWLADRFFGKFNTILWFSLIYCAGHGMLAMFEDSAAGFYAGLFLIALGAGGIKPLVASFMGDQFDERNKHLAKVVFDAFYWIINFGSFFASFFMPVILKDYGAKVAFGVPGILMLIATIVFWVGSKRYVRIAIAPPNPNSFLRVIRTALFARGNGDRVGLIIAVAGLVLAVGALATWPLGWLLPVASLCLALVCVLVFGGIGAGLQLDRARGVHGDAAVNGVRAVLKVLVVFALVTPFHSLFDQKATVWVEQAKHMASPGFTIDLWFMEMRFLPAQMQLFNPLLVMLLIPFNNLVLYPLLRRAGYEPTTLRRMTWGIAFAGAAWIIVGGLQLAMDAGDRVSILWQILPYVVLTFGEIFVSATGLEFAYSQAPFEMKGVIMSFWNLTTTIGNLWVLLVDAAIRNDSAKSMIADTGLSEPAFLMFFFAAFAFVIALVFKLYTRRYQLVDNYRAATGAAPLPEARIKESKS